MLNDQILLELPSGFCHFFGGPENIQAHFRVKLVHLKKEICLLIETKHLSQDEEKCLIRHTHRLDRVLKSELITEEMVARIASAMVRFVRYESFYEIVVPKGKTRREVIEDIRVLVGTHPIAETPHFLVAAMAKAGTEMEMHFAGKN